MNKLYAAWVNREAHERFGKSLCDLTEDELRSIEGQPGCVRCGSQHDVDESDTGLCGACRRPGLTIISGGLADSLRTEPTAT